MSKKGGYAIVDLRDSPLVDSNTEKVTITGTYSIASQALANRRAVLLSGITLKENAQADALQFPDSFGTAWQETQNQISIRAAAGGKVLMVHVTDDDGVIAEVG